jgi:ubiquinone/menaquinone biosynthesis C-methylase UbiE
MKMSSIEKRFVNRPSHSTRVATRAERLVRTTNPQRGQQLLDVGCGNGAAAIRLAQTFGLSVTGVDIDPGQITAATSAAGPRSGVRFLAADATALPFPDGEFDLVYTNKTTHHIPHWEHALEEMVRVLKPGGHLIYSDFVAPLGRRLPTRSGINRIAEEHRLQAVLRQQPFCHDMSIFRAPTGRPG